MTLAVQLHLDFAPDPVRAHGLRAAHPRPLVSMGKRAGRPFRSWRTSPEKAWKYPELEYGNAGSSIAALVLDCDKPRAMACGLFELPPPNWIVRRPANNHAHVAWTLAEPVHRYPQHESTRCDTSPGSPNISPLPQTRTRAMPGCSPTTRHAAPSRPTRRFGAAWGRTP